MSGRGENHHHRMILTAIITTLLSVNRLFAAGVSETTPLTAVQRGHTIEYQDGRGNVVSWTDDWGRIHTPELMQSQRKYNSLIHGQFGGGLVLSSGLSAPEGIVLMAPEPPGRRGIGRDGKFAVPLTIWEHGVMTRDTLSIPFFEFGIRWNRLAEALKESCGRAKARLNSIDCDRYQMNWITDTSGARQPEADDPFFFGRWYADLRRGLDALRGLQATLETVITVSIGGEHGDAAHDRDLYETRNSQCLSRTFLQSCMLDANDLPHPYDWLTAEVVMSGLTPSFLERLHAQELSVEKALSSADSYQDLNASAVSAHDLGQ